MIRTSSNQQCILAFDSHDASIFPSSHFYASCLRPFEKGSEQEFVTAGLQRSRSTERSDNNIVDRVHPNQKGKMPSCSLSSLMLGWSLVSIIIAIFVAGTQLTLLDSSSSVRPDLAVVTAAFNDRNDKDHVDDMDITPSWQTVVPDTGIVIPLISSPEQTWILSSSPDTYNNIPATVPGDLISDLLKAGMLLRPDSTDEISRNTNDDDDPYFNRNFITQRDVWMGHDDYDDDDDILSRDNTFSSYSSPSSRSSFTKWKTWKRRWVYTTMFELPRASSDESAGDLGSLPLSWKLVVEGLKMGARVLLNGIELGTVRDQFLRYDFWLPNDALTRTPRTNNDKTTKHNLTIVFDPTIEVDGRFMACSGGWDWAPYVRARDRQGIQMYTLGVVKPIYLVGVHEFSIQHVVPKTYYLGEYPKEPMKHGPDGDFLLNIDIHLHYAPSVNQRYRRHKENRKLNNSNMTMSSLSSLLLIRSDFGIQNDLEIPVDTLSSSVVTHSSIVSKEKIKLWWPNGMGEQPLYDFSVETSMKGLCCNQMKKRNGLQMKIVKRIGFRATALVTVDETRIARMEVQQSSHDKDEGSGQHGMYFRVNGAIVMARGANFIPMDQLEGRLDGRAHRTVVQSAAQANMNMIRIWGGGMIPPKDFYDACDEEGILLYHDMMFVDEEGHRPIQTLTVEQEIRHVVRELAVHPSIIVWNGCNECNVTMGTPSEIYATFVMETVAQEDDSRSLWPSSPSRHGWATGVRSQDSRPLLNGRKLTTRDPKPFFGVLESHGPYMRSFSHTFPGVNGQDVGFPYKNTPPVLKEVPVGPSYQNEFSSEFGSSVMTSFESISATLSHDNWSLHGNGTPNTCAEHLSTARNCSGDNVLSERNYPCDSHIQAYFGYDELSLSKVGKVAFQKQLYLCLISQTLWMKGEIESRRSRNMYGNLIWQLNENWPTGGWGVIEYSANSEDGGRWKPLMHLLEQALFRDHIVACGKDDVCYLRNDGMNAAEVKLEFHAWRYSGRNSFENEEIKLNFFLLAGVIQWFQLPSHLIGNAQVVLIDMKVNNVSKSHSFFLRDVPKNVVGLESTTDAVKIVSIRPTSDGAAVVEIESRNLALLIVITASTQGRFSENCMNMLPREKKIVRFESMIPGKPVDTDSLQKTVRLEHMAQYMLKQRNESIMEDQIISKATWRKYPKIRRVS